MDFLKAFGPGIIFAGAAIGNSHLVQSTRAGAVYGLALLSIVILANLLKYPAFRFGPGYAAATGTSLVDGYLRLGKPVLLIVVISEFAVQIIIFAASAITAAAIMIAVFDLTVDARYLAVALLGGGAAVLLAGGYKLLDRLTKIFVAALTVATLAATAMTIPTIQWSTSALLLPDVDKQTFVFIVALVGFMPSALNLSIIHSLWSVAKSNATGFQPDTKQAMVDFNIGYVCSGVLAICFVLMGAGVMHGSGVSPATSPGEFARQIISLYTENLGAWSGLLVGMSALCVMFSTLIAVIDGMPRMQATSIQKLLGGTSTRPIERTRLYYSMMAIQGGGAALILLFLMRNFTDFIDFVTITSFVVSPLLALLNHLVMTRDPVPPHLRPGAALRLWSWLAILAMTVISVLYFATLISG